ncbi:hypothetical protein QBC40DRAFT_237853 [Triangularia verruculosa]|uniref:Kinetochore protein mis14 n=1 Tax=Triangularia verruculosa TaxID=2587418 RepID=A0AAN6X6Y7_9PEZI|nr:hypothetical protein QBC40DRAFT_237853 [Triangularia verruculosa]
MDDSIQRKIELQSPDDLRYLITNVRKAATDSINAAFPPVLDEEGNPIPQEEDELRNQIDKLVNDYITKTFTLALPSLSINGSLSPPPSPTTLFSHPSHLSPSSGPETQYEPFDPRKRDKIESLVSQEEDLLRSIAQLKRKVPSSTASSYITATNAQLASDEQLLSTVITHTKKEGLDRGRKALEGMGELDRQESVENSYARAVDTLAKLKSELPTVVAKMERARVAGEYVVGKQHKKK